MATSVTFNGSTYSIPANREPRGWGTSLSAFLVDVANNSLSKAGGNFTLSADINFGPTYGLVAKYIKSASSNIAQTGVVRLANTDKITFRNNANGADLNVGVSASDRLQFESVNIPTISSTDTLTNKTLTSPTITNPTLTDPVMSGQSSAPTYAAGKLWYDTADNTMRYFNDSTGDSVNIGQEINVKVRNTSGSTITAGQVVRITGAVSGVPTVSLGQANSFANSRVFAVVTETIANNTNGYATVNGLIKNLALNAFSDGDLLYLSPSVAGGLTSTRPTSPNYVMPVGAVASNNSSTGRLIVQIGALRKLGYGTASQILGMNAAGTEEEYVASSGTGSVLRQTGPAIDGYLDIDEESAPGTPSANRVRIYAKADAKIYKKDDAGVETQLATTAEALSNPMTTSGDIIYGGGSGAASRLAGNTTTAKQYLTQTGNGSASAAPVWSAFPGATNCAAYLNASQTGLTSGNAVKVAFGTEEFDNGSFYDNATNFRIQPTIAGKYQISWGVRVFGNTGDTVRVALTTLYKNGAAFKNGSGFGHGSAAQCDSFYSSGSILVDANGSSDYFEIFATTTVTASTWVIGNGQGNTFFTCVRVSD